MSMWSSMFSCLKSRSRKNDTWDRSADAKYGWNARNSNLIGFDSHRYWLIRCLFLFQTSDGCCFSVSLRRIWQLWIIKIYCAHIDICTRLLDAARQPRLLLWMTWQPYPSPYQQSNRYDSTTRILSHIHSRQYVMIIKLTHGLCTNPSLCQWTRRQITKESNRIGRRSSDKLPVRAAQAVKEVNIAKTNSRGHWVFSNPTFRHTGTQPCYEGSKTV